MKNQELAETVTSVLADEFSDKSLKLSVIGMVEKNLLYKDVITSFIKVLPNLKDESLKLKALSVMRSISLNEIENLDEYSAILSDELEREQSESVHVVVIDEIKRVLSVKPVLITKLIEVVSDNEKSERKVKKILSSLKDKNNLKSEHLEMLFKQGATYPAYLQKDILDLVRKQKNWNKSFQEISISYLNSSIDPSIRIDVLQVLKSQPELYINFWSCVEDALLNDLSKDLRLCILEFIIEKNEYVDFNQNTLQEIAENDGDEDVRALAQKCILMSTQKENSGADFVLKQISEESSREVKEEALLEARKHIRDEGFRTQLTQVMINQFKYKDEKEFKDFFSLLSPYLNRSKDLVDKIFELLKVSKNIQMKESVLEIVTQSTKDDKIMDSLVKFYKQEKDFTIKSKIMSFFIAKSPIDWPEIYPLLIEEYLEPSSELRVSICKQLSSSLDREDVRESFEDVILNDQDSDLIRYTVDFYLKENSNYKFEVLFEILKNTSIALGTKKRSVEEMQKMDLDSADKSKVKEHLDRHKIGGFDEF